MLLAKRIHARAPSCGAVVFAAGVAFVGCGPAGTERVGTDVVQLLPEPNATSGAIFTTLADGTSVNHNIYDAKEDVYLDGGPGPNAPSTAAGLGSGDYFFQVTDPSGKDLLSSDAIGCRRVHVNAAGVIDLVYAGTNYVWQAGHWVPVACRHVQGIDSDHADLGAITVQLFPYDDTPNSGGVYKVWMTPVDKWTGNVNYVPQNHSDAVNQENWQPGDAHGFVPADSKTDNFKVRKGKPCEPSLLTVRKFHDANANGLQDLDEALIDGWLVAVEDPIGTSNTLCTPVSVVAQAGVWTVVEDTPAGTLETASFLDGVATAPPESAISVTFANGCYENHDVLFGNVALGEATVCKVYDRDGDGVADGTEPVVAQWMMQLTGTTVLGAPVGPTTALTGEDGCAHFDSLLPGSYTVQEIMPTTGGWVATGPISSTFDIASNLDGSTLTGTTASATFTNVCTALANFDTKGYWHNKNGLTELTDADIAYANGLLPYATPSTYFDAGDEPFDGHFTDGTPVAAALGSWGDEVAPAGSPKAEVSQFLVDTNATGDPREQLAQQLLAFVFNTRHRLDSPSAAIQMSDGSFVSAATIIDQAITAWFSGRPAEQQAVASMLDAFNNSDALPTVLWNPCAVTYP